MTNRVLVLESILYGIIGGILGCILGIIVLYGMAFVIANDPYVQVDVSIKFTWPIIPGINLSNHTFNY